MAELIGVYGAGGCGRGLMPLVRDQFAVSENVELVFVDDGQAGRFVNGQRVVSFADFCVRPARAKRMVLAVADGGVRRRLAVECEAASIDFFEVRAANVVIMDDVSIGVGAALSPGVVVTSNIRIGHHFHCNIGSIVEHDCVIGDYVTFAPGVRCNGNIEIGDGAYIGAGAMIRQGRHNARLKIGAGATIGMGAVVIADVPDGVTIVGNPGRPIARSS
ncbi:acetyltransferase [Sphingomonas sp. SUN039]|uniref:acetyltransferase n=1 Tax=Sphingomonas sp. SUN039 TaxID=2937787 RepID=UPI002164792A|nr:acetyltransferase [Sphingomonas sp. SUN039]UVO52858.1 acetyltransferase [Sphingomonas sp. SUN039]